MRQLLLSLLIATLVSGVAEAQTLRRVPGDFSTIQAAINAAQTGDTVRVAPGIYVENINFLGKAIAVVSEGGPDVTIIDGGQANSVVVFISGEGASSLLEGFTIRNGKPPSLDDGGGIRIASSSPTVRRNYIVNNSSCLGGGISINFASPVVQGNVISGNGLPGCSNRGGGIHIGGNGSAQILDNIISNNNSNTGGGISMFAAGTPLIRGNIITGNSAGGDGGGISMVNFSDAKIIQNLIAGNNSQRGGGIYWLVPGGSHGPYLTQNTLVDNHAGQQGSGLFADGFDAATPVKNNIIVGKAGQNAIYCGNFNDTNSPIFAFNNVFSDQVAPYAGACSDVTGTNGNISAAPLFVDRDSGNFRLMSGSPGINVGDNSVPDVPAVDLDSIARIIPNAGTIDMGAYEFPGSTTSTISQDTLTFSDQTAGTVSAATDITVTNTGTETLYFGTITVTGDFVQTNTCQTANGIPAGQTCTISVSFAPTAGAPRTGQLTVHTNAANYIVSLSGTGISLLTLPATTLDLGSQRVGTPGVATNFSISNADSNPLSISSIVTTGDFTSTHDCPASLPAAGSCTVSIQFSPAAREVRYGSLIITSGAPDSPHIVTLFGRGLAPVISFTPTILQFASQSVGTTSAPQNVTVANIGDVAMLIQNISVTGDFSKTADNCGTSLDVNQTCTISVTFSPLSIGTRSGSIIVADDAIGSPHSFALSGTGSGTFLSVSQTDIAFGNQTIFTTSATRTITLRNTGGIPLTITSIVTTGEFSRLGNCTTVNPGQLCPIAIAFNPTSVGPKTGTVTITSSAIGSPHVVNLSGIGIAGGVFLSPTSLQFQTDLIGTSSLPQVATLTNQAPATLTLSSITASGDFTQTNNCATTLAPGASCGITTRFLPSAEGLRSGAITIASDGSGSPHSVSLSGTGLSSLPVPVVTGLNPNARVAGGTGFTLTVTGIGFSSLSVVRWNGTDRSTVFVSNTTLTATIPASDITTPGVPAVTVFNPTPGGGVSNNADFVVYRAITLTTKDLIYDRAGARIFASVGSAAPNLANTLTPIDPVTGSLGSATPVGSDPGKLAISRDSRSIYIALDGAAQIRLFDTVSQTAGVAFGLGNDPSFGPYYAEDIAVDPERPETIAVSRRRPTVLPRHGGVAIYDNGVQRPTVTADHTGSNAIEYSSTSATLYGFNAESTEYGFRTMSVGPTGVAITNVTENLITTFEANIQFEAGRIYATTGQIIDPVSRSLITTLPMPTGGEMKGVVADSSLGRVFYLFASTTSVRILGFNTTDFVQVGTLNLPGGLTANIGSLVRWGDKGLAFRSGSQVVTLRIPDSWLPSGPPPVSKVRRDFNGDGKSDILWRDTAGNLSMWRMNGYTILNETLMGNVWTGWTIAGSGDFNADGRMDILWRDPVGTTVIWLMDGASQTSYAVVGVMAPQWAVAGVADFNGDGKADVLWRSESGDIVMWLMDGFRISSNALLGNVWTGWTIAGTGDFNADGKADILWREGAGDVAIWLMNGTTLTSGTTIANVWPEWRIVGTGDFNADGKADILWRASAGDVAIWLMNGTTLFAGTIVANVWTGWTIVGTGDYNGDGSTDILWRDEGGSVVIWSMNGTTISSFSGMGNVVDRMAQ